jgi:hypothetical protein
MKKYSNYFILGFLFFCALNIKAQSKQDIATSNKKHALETNSANKSSISTFESSERTATSTNTIITTPLNNTNSDPVSKTGVSNNVTILAPDTAGALSNKKHN